MPIGQGRSVSTFLVSATLNSKASTALVPSSQSRNTSACGEKIVSRNGPAAISPCALTRPPLTGFKELDPSGLTHRGTLHACAPSACSSKRAWGMKRCKGVAEPAHGMSGLLSGFRVVRCRVLFCATLCASAKGTVSQLVDLCADCTAAMRRLLDRARELVHKELPTVAHWSAPCTISKQ